MKTFNYKGYDGTCETSIEDGICYGKILFINDLIMYQSETVPGLKQAFESAVDDYLQTCKQLNVEAKKPLKGQFNVRVSPELHKKAVLRASNDDSSLNDVVKLALESYLSGSCDINHHYNFSFVKQDQDTVVNFAPSMNTSWLTMPSKSTIGSEHVH